MKELSSEERSDEESQEKANRSFEILRFAQDDMTC